MLAYCPFHGEEPGVSTPSFCVDVETGYWICYAECGGGGIHTFLKEMGENRHTIEDRTKHIKPAKKKKKKARQALFLPKALLGLFHHCPKSLLDDGFDMDVLEYHGIGFDLVKQIPTFPVFDKDGNLLTVIGRQHNSSRYGKYMPYTLRDLKRYGIEFVPDFVKINVFWREDKFFLTDDCYTRNVPIIVCEGFKSAMWLVQHGYNNVVALMGTNMTEYHVSLLEKLGKTVILCLDGDGPGIISTIRCANMLRSLVVKSVVYEGGITQTDDLKTPERVTTLIDGAVSIAKFKRLHKSKISEMKQKRKVNTKSKRKDYVYRK